MKRLTALFKYEAPAVTSHGLLALRRDREPVDFSEAEMLLIYLCGVFQVQRTKQAKR